MTASQMLPRSAAQPSAVRAHCLGDFRSAVSSSFVPLEVSPAEGASAPGFAAGLRSAEADGVVFTEVAALPHLVERTDSTIAQGGSGYYKVSLLLEGSSVLVQDGRELVMRPGDLSIYDTSRPYSLLFTEEFRNLIMMFPKDRLDIPTPFVEQVTAEQLGADVGLAPVVAAFLAQFPGQLPCFPEHVRAKLGHTSLDLVSTLLSQQLDVELVTRDPHHLLLQKIHTFIDAQLHDPELSPGMIARAHYISTRHLHTLFRELDTTVSTWIRERRLERCRADLLNPVLNDRTIATIALRWGFTDAAHFSRVFKAHFGTSPSSLR